MKTFRSYLESKSIVESSIIRMESQIGSWLKWLQIPVEDSSYKNLMSYIKNLQGQDKSINHINRNLITISHYYQYQNLPNIALTTRLKGERIKVLSKPIKVEDLERIYQDFESSELDKIIIGLMIYQGLEPGDFKTIEIKDINLEKGTIYIPSRTERRSRTLALESHQILLLQNFLFSIERTTEKFFSPYIDNPNHFGYLLQKLSKKIKQEAKEKYQIEIIKLSHLRQSRIAIWVKEEGIRKGQYKAGFRRVMSAERYRKADLENLREQINLHHPFK